MLSKVMRFILIFMFSNVQEVVFAVKSSCFLKGQQWTPDSKKTLCGEQIKDTVDNILILFD